ncbi:inactive beta-amylase 9 [Lactuca sativa]|uniref:Beta-amylase n=1 Tax=Lactuca sativa TaxID=4236 RepID=A0A9R1XGW0_LACSA|nr:inactive beta-amylase 9 [Lactuca sativa]KAJ0207482.1 hypothetical protein LSAT_V11C500246680 [Lactuca sativa]
MEMSLIVASPVKFSQLGNNNNNNSIPMIICSSSTKSRIGFCQITKCPNVSLKVATRSISISHSHHAVSIKASEDNAISKPKDGVKLYVGLPMNSVSDCHAINHSRAISAGLRALKLLGVEGVELPIWWGVAEKEAMGKYQWSGYLTLVDMIQKAGLKLHVTLCFHGSKQENIHLPKWVSEIGQSEPDIFFADRSGKRYKDCLSFGVDDLPIFHGKTAMNVYQGFIESFKTSFSPFMGSTITGITIGMGPDGELRYPSHQDQNKNKISLGAGEFQCYDQNMMNNLKKHSENHGNPNWGLSGPHDAPSYNQHPIINTFFKEGGSWKTPYGDFFLSWYSTQLVSHADKILSMAASSFSDTPVILSGKLPLIHSWYRTRSHPAEVAAGFCNTVNRYEEIIKVFHKNSCRMILPGMDLLDEQQPNELCSSPEMLLEEIRDGCRKNGVEVCGQNLEIAGNSESFEQIRKNLVGGNGIEVFVYQRMGAEFFSPVNFPLFSAFVRRIKELELELDSDDLGGNGRDSAVFVPGKNRKMQAA